MKQTYTRASHQALQDSNQAILIVDDEPTFRTIVSEILGACGYTVSQASNVELALQMLAQRPIDLVLTDVMMPGIDGLTFVRRLRAEPATCTIPTVVVSALSMPEHIAETFIAGADACLVKPFSAQELRDTIKDLINGRSTKYAC
jgi:two-component system, chemotaxis family, chemotaxis protein CheY